MLAIGRALMGRPKLLLLDEPSMGLAPELVAQIFSIITEINAQGTTILLVEQNATQALHARPPRLRPRGGPRREDRRRRTPCSTTTTVRAALPGRGEARSPSTPAATQLAEADGREDLGERATMPV